MLEKQIDIYSLDTGDFYSNHEAHLHWLNHTLRVEKNQLINGFTLTNKSNKNKRTIVGLKEIERKLKDFGLNDSDLFKIVKGNYEFGLVDETDRDNVISLCERYCNIKKIIDIKNVKIKESKEKLLKLLANKTEINKQTKGKHHIRELREDAVSDKKIISAIISVFDSSFTRMISAEQDKLCEDFVVVQIYYFSVLKDLINFGFVYKGEKYIYFTSSAGQIRTKKTVFVKESVWNKHEKTIMCGLTLNEINKKGGNNPNKHLAYLALNNSATDVWKEFDIDKTIVIDDFETNVFGTYDFVDETDYSVKRISDYVLITHTDGAGMILPNAFGVKQKNQMVRLPWIKGLLGVFDYRRFIEINNCSSVIKDIYGVEHDVFAEDIQVIFTKSQFKLSKYYSSWNEYKEYYKKYDCSAGYTNAEEDRIKNATLNYQMLQTLSDITDEEILEITKTSIDSLNNLCSSTENVLNTFGISPYNLSPTYFQQAIELYPNLVNDEYAKRLLRNIKDSMIKKYKSGKLKIKGKYTFILPDFYAACEYWFKGIANPNGLLDDGEVFCWLFRKSEKLDCLRSPHLFCEHAVRKNTAYCNNEKQLALREWFNTKAIYTSCKDLISKLLMFDCDGDKSLVVSDGTIIKVAERNADKYDIVPLYYNMRKAEATQLNSQSIYNGLIAAFTGGNIGIYSNNISKIWNSEIFISGSEEERKEALNCIKLLCCENNFIIDYAKTLYKPERPKDIHEKIISYTKSNLPHFFKYAKDKNENQIAEKNLSFVNKLDDLIPNPRISYKRINLDSVDYKLLMNNPDIDCEVILSNNGKIVKSETNPLIVKYCELNKYYFFKVDVQSLCPRLPNEVLMRNQSKYNSLFSSIITDVKNELNKFGYTEKEITDILIKYLYGVTKKNPNKGLLWLCYGNVIVDNLKKNGCKPTKKTIQCVDCGEWIQIDISNKRTCRCDDCQAESTRIKATERKRKQREKHDVTLLKNI